MSTPPVVVSPNKVASCTSSSSLLSSLRGARSSCVRIVSPTKAWIFPSSTTSSSLSSSPERPKSSSKIASTISPYNTRDNAITYLSHTMTNLCAKDPFILVTKGAGTSSFTQCNDGILRIYLWNEIERFLLDQCIIRKSAIWRL